MDTYSAAVIGCGRIGSLYDAGRPEASENPLTHAGGYAIHPRVSLVAGVDPLAERRVQFSARWQVPAFATCDDMLAQVRPEVWSICTNAETHLEVALAALQAGARGIWCEKPMTATLAEAVRLVAACEQAGVPLSINHSRRFDALHQDVARRLQAGEWGPVERVLIHYVRGIANYGSHAFDLLRMLLADEIDWVAARDELREPGPDASLTVNGQMRGGVPFSLLPTRRPDYDSLEVDVWCRAGRVTLTHLGRGVRQYRVGPSPDWDEPAVLLETPGQFPRGMEGMIPAAISNLIAALEQTQPLLSSGRDGLAALTAVWAAKASAELQGKPVWLEAVLKEISELAQASGGNRS